MIALAVLIAVTAAVVGLGIGAWLDELDRNDHDR